MKSEPCDQYRKILQKNSCGELSPTQLKAMADHAQQCASCWDYLQALDCADQTMTQWVQSLEPLLESGCSETIRRLGQMPEHGYHAGHSSVRWRWCGYVAAACILIAAGILVGRQWAASTQPQMEARITASVIESLRPDVIREYTKMQDALSVQITTELQAYAEETVLRNDIQTYSLLTQLIEAIQTAQVQNQQWALSAMQELDQQRLLDQEKVRSEFAAFASYTGDELLRTRQELQSLTAKQN